ncbi:DUF2270 family protein [Natrialba magadii ATCC 43099]|uniref:DUF2270 family protein n=1 Tax=Natrialba magadii (strain ATCC 43099 / DSM 3394 / CCM 3739 / CIP 104546 / IAM 13178 / JCM 8861 / NBRC 102185 / NCIMB 2190 / MS3) TaxID=547559 RepID=D3SS49_NATMM|nr:DUF2270 domain-containing protein [Natrialba magadii]ADD04775.1 DUF2270 family protein [Natrialba magadii ATCC 43099]ELY24941.1 hypothetical protein C500_18483 [Natrialba magadii ATCC 43099]
MGSDNEQDATEEELGDEIGEEISTMNSVLGDAYRGELDRETTWRGRLDQTTTWSVTVMAAILTWAFSSPDNPHYIILVAVLAVTTFLVIEARRYRDYDVYRSRVRLFQKNLLADALDPSQGLTHDDWRTQLSSDYRRPTVKITFLEAASNRLRRIYLALLFVLLLAWIFRVTAFATGESFRTAASVGDFSGTVVSVVVGVFYAVILVISLWPHDRGAMGEFRKGEEHAWKRTG